MRAPALDSGSLRLPHFGDCTHEGQPLRARALGDQPQRVLAQLLEAGEGGPRDPDPAGVPVVDEDRRRRRSGGGSWWTARRCPSGRTSRSAAAPRSGRARSRAARRAAPRGRRVVRRAPEASSSNHSAWVAKLTGGRSSATRSTRGMVGEAPALVGEDGVGDAHLAEGERHAERLAAVEQAHDLGVGLALGLGVPVALEGRHERAAAARGRARAPRRSARGAGRSRPRGPSSGRAPPRSIPSSSPEETSTIAKLSRARPSAARPPPRGSRRAPGGARSVAAWRMLRGRRRSSPGAHRAPPRGPPSAARGTRRPRRDSGPSWAAQSRCER